MATKDARPDVVEALMEAYKGYLPIEKIGEGIAASLENAKGLAEDAELLLAHGRYPRAMSLSLSSLEELGKVRVLKSMVRISSSNQKLWADRWKAFASHEAKSSYAFVDTLPDESAFYPDIVLAGFIANRMNADVQERVRQWGLYVDWSNADKGWRTPQEIKAEHARSRLLLAQKGIERLDGFRRAGWFAKDVLQLEHQFLSPLCEKLPKMASVTGEDLARILPLVEQAMTEFFQAIRDTDLVDLPHEPISNVPLVAKAVLQELIGWLEEAKT